MGFITIGDFLCYFSYSSNERLINPKPAEEYE
jgi:hypothetical protein